MVAYLYKISLDSIDSFRAPNHDTWVDTTTDDLINVKRMLNGCEMKIKFEAKKI